MPELARRAADPRPGSPAFQRLQARWDDRLAAAGFRDIERSQKRPAPFTRDTDPYTTLDQRHTSLDTLGPDYVTAAGDELTALEYWERRNLLAYGQPTSWAETDLARLWALLQRQELPRNYRHRRFIVAWTASGDPAAAARGIRITPKQARVTIARFCARLQVRVPHVRAARAASSPPAPPSPVRVLSRAEIEALTYQPPRKRP